MKKTLLALTLCGLMTGCNSTMDNHQTQTMQTRTPAKAQFNIEFEKFTLDNGLTVLLHQDRSDPIVALSTVVHVGASREKPGRTGFAHFFEHMSFNDSENVPKGANRKMIPELGGSRNGGTWSDGTIYYEVVPVDAFEKLLWIDSDRFGYMINTVTEPTLEREKQVVKNEKRQRVDNRAYGHTQYVIKKALYPKEHPYNWTTIGELEDLQNATLQDVREFYDQFYVPSNATLVIAGDIDIEQTKAKVKQWFGEIKAGEPVADLAPMPVSLDKTVKLYHLDNFAKLPELRITVPTVEQYHPDSYALAALGSILADGKNSPLFTTLVKEKKLAPGVSAGQDSNELAGTFSIRVRANAGVKLDEVYAAIEEALESFEAEGVRDNDLARIKASQETDFYNEISSILNKSLQLGIYNEFAGDPNYAGKDIANILAVSKEDVLRVYRKYVKNQPAVITSFVPKEQEALVLSDSVKANVKEEEIVAGAEKTFVEKDNVEFVKTPSKHDRSEPPLGEQPATKMPDIWQHEMASGIKLLGVEHKELPLVNFSIRIDGGQWLDETDKLGTANLLAKLMTEGTASMTPAEMEDAIGMLGATLRVNATKEGIEIRGNALAKHFDKLIGFVSEMIMTPRFDEEVFSQVKARQLSAIKQLEGNPGAVARQVFLSKLYGDSHVGGQPMGGTLETVSRLTLADVKAWHAKNFSADLASVHVVGDIAADQVKRSLAKLNRSWQKKPVEFVSQMPPESVTKPQVYFVDIPNAKQSVLYVGKPAVKGDDPLYDLISIANNRLGANTSARLMQVLRIEKGYTYGAGSGITRNKYTGAFMARTQVRSNVTLESLNIIKDLVGNYGETFLADDLVTAKNLISKGYSRRFETLSQITDVLEQISSFNLPLNYVEKQQQLVRDIKMDEVQQIIKDHMNEQNMIYLVVGDAKTQLENVKAFGYGEPIMLDVHGKVL